MGMCGHCQCSRQGWRKAAARALSWLSSFPHVWHARCQYYGIVVCLHAYIGDEASVRLEVQCADR